ncbi:extracellular solute-binding protein [Streptomyces roseoverticillatus]|uniref:extracellular solute-binding protein n=1 Tax=Streptomyces roseoverticillatus TaxID=66429 RepID=UPI000B2F8B91|nr:extracellular solute-binding protein [Streptomyces roseoverticillatus]
MTAPTTAPAGPTGPAAGLLPGTRSWLIRRLAALLTATVLACGALFTAFYGVSRGADEVPGRTIPAMGYVDGAETALRQSLAAAKTTLNSPAAPAEGPGEEYKAKLNAAFRSLEKAAAATVAGGGRNDLDTVAGQLSSYDYLIGQAARSQAAPGRADERLRDTYLRYADSTLNREKSGILARLKAVQDEQTRVLVAQTSSGRLLKSAWGVAVALWAVLVWLLADTQRFLRRRFHRRFNGPLVGATVLVAALVPVLLPAALRLQDDLDWARAHSIPRGGETASEHMAAMHWLTAVPAGILLAAVVAAALVVLGLQPRIEEYRFARVPQRPGRRIRSFEAATVLLALWLVLLSAIGAGDVRTVHNGRISVLATWTDAEQEHFQALLDAYAAKYHVNVDYQGTTALREVLLSRLNAGNPPDIAILPSLGEVQAYLKEKPRPRSLRPVLNETLNAYGPLWAPRFGNEVYAVAVKADLKSIVWYDPARGQSPRALAARGGGQWCAGMGGDGTSGWPGTDWIEDILLQQSGTEAYEKWARGELPWTEGPVRDAWEAFGGIFTKGPAAAALDNDWGQKILTSKHCTLQHQASFARDADYTGRAAFAPTRDVLPDIARHPAATEVSADYATLFAKKGSKRGDAAEDLLRFLTTRQAQEVWASALSKEEKRNKITTHPGRPFFVTAGAPRPDPGTERVNAAVSRTLGGPQPKCLDASDMMPLRMRFAFQHGVLDYLSDPGPEKQRQVLDYLEGVRKELKGAPGAASPRVCE